MTKPPDDVEFANFFECEPTMLDPTASWIFNTLTFETERDGTLVWFQISPSYSTLEVVLSAQGRELARAKIGTFTALEIVSERGQETLVVSYGEMDASRLWLTLRPEVRLTLQS